MFKETCVFGSIFTETLDGFQYYKKSFFLNVTFGGYFCTGGCSDKYHLPQPNLVSMDVLRSVFNNTEFYNVKCKDKAIPLQARRVPEGPRKLRFPDFVTMAQDGGRLSALRTGRIYPQEILLALISFRG